MRIGDLYESSLTDQEIHDLCREYGLKKDKYVIVDGKVHVNGSVVPGIHTPGMMPIPFEKVVGSFVCDNSSLTTLKNTPRTVGENCWVDHNKLTSLDYSPEIIGKNYHCNNSLTTLDGGPSVVEQKFKCHENPLPVESFVFFGTMDRLGGVKTDDRTFNKIMNECLTEMKHDLTSYKDKIEVQMIIRYGREKTQ